MTRLTRSVCLLLLVVAMPSLHAEDRVPVFVRSVANADGFTDPSKARRDSLKDLLNKVKDSKVLRVADSEADAVAILEVLDRQTRRETNAWALLDGGQQNKSTLLVRLIAGPYATEFEGEAKSSGIYTGYKDAAKKVVRQVEDWVQANRERLTASR